MQKIVSLLIYLWGSSIQPTNKEYKEQDEEHFVHGYINNGREGWTDGSVFWRWYSFCSVQFSLPTPKKKTNKHQLKNLFKPMNVFNKNDFLSGDL